MFQYLVRALLLHTNTVNGKGAKEDKHCVIIEENQRSKPTSRNS